MADNKLLLPWTDGEAIVVRVVGRYVEAGVAPIVVVTGRDAAEVCGRLKRFPVIFAHNRAYATGEMLSSVKVGLRALDAGLAAAFIQPGDMPCVSVDVIVCVASGHVSGFNVAPVHRGRRGHPLLLDRAYWREMLALSGDARPRDVIEGARDKLKLVAGDMGALMDVDTRGAYARALERGCAGDTPRN